MSEPERRDEKPERPRRRRVPNVADAMGLARPELPELPEDGDGLGPLGKQTLHVLLDEAKREQAEKRLPYLFTKYGRDFFDRMHPERWDALDERIDSDMERKALWKFWKRVMLASVPIGGTVFAYASGFLDKGLPLIKRFIELFKATPT